MQAWIKRTAVLAASLTLWACATQRLEPFDVVESTIPEMQAAMADGRTTAIALVDASLARIAAHDDDLNAVMALNPDARAIARRLDAERRAGTVRGALHGIPIAVKDIINTTAMPTTGGALAFDDYVPPYDADVVTRLEAAGAIVIAKTTNTELANWVADGMPGNYSAVGGQGVNPYGAHLEAGGSSSGIGTAMSFWAASIGTETSGSILYPSNATLLVAIKPTLGRVSTRGIMPITADQDVAGPMARSVVDAALVLAAIESDSSPCAPLEPATEQVAIDGARIGVPRSFASPLLDSALDALRARGAMVIDVAILTADANRNWQVCAGPDDAKGSDDDCSVVFKYGMKRDFNAYLATLGESAPVKTLTALRAFNIDNAHRGAIRYGQAQLDISDEMDVAADRERYLADRAKDLELARGGLDGVFEAHRLDALLFPRSSGAPIAARAGYPSVMVPAGFDGGAPYGVMFTGPACSEQRLLEIAHAVEQVLGARIAPPR
ncbi:MAG: amidase family protein [Gammaproteobacteria bacterium]